MTESNQDIAQMAQAILRAHGARFGLAESPATAQFTSQGSTYRAAKTACMALGFIEIDAECVARAWQAQTDRLGRFDATLWPVSPLDFGMQVLPVAQRPDAFAPCPRQLGLYAVLPDAKWTGRCARAGVPTVQLRFKSDDDLAIEQEVHAAVDAVRGTGALLFINDHWRAAIAAGAYGVHLGQEDLDALRPEELSQIRVAGLRLGVSTHGYAEMVRADAVSPSYLAMGAVFPTTLKKMATAPQGLARLDAYARLTSQYPQVAIGGIDAERLPAVLATGVGSVAVVRAIIAADDPEGACRELGLVIDSATGRRGGQ
ncbi:thiamine phosphate synthase [Variovorax dokdonensis]|uniref:Thiamine phosphate synthase n=1 Tax=Variovorax dokdonensis TaxID=344883 RepID=A0ABT7NH27_9BURK|nr:thiamine phosphate synthase [Variovorax dokdonensis]MDM0047244.1 thiamine phosphate synthase [Variovorax dokdonensis]